MWSLHSRWTQHTARNLQHTWSRQCVQNGANVASSTVLASSAQPAAAAAANSAAVYSSSAASKFHLAPSRLMAITPSSINAPLTLSHPSTTTRSFATDSKKPSAPAVAAPAAAPKPQPAYQAKVAPPGVATKVKSSPSSSAVATTSSSSKLSATTKRTNSKFEAASALASTNRLAAQKSLLTRPLSLLDSSSVPSSSAEHSSQSAASLVGSWKFPSHYDPRFEPPPLNSFEKNKNFRFDLFDAKAVGKGITTAESVKFPLDLPALKLWHRRYAYWISAQAKSNALKVAQRKDYVGRKYPTRLTASEEQFQKFIRSDEFAKWESAAKLSAMPKQKFNPALEPSAMFPDEMDTSADKYHPSFEPIAPELWEEYGVTARDSIEYRNWFNNWLKENPEIAVQREMYQKLVHKYVAPVWRARMIAESERMIGNEQTRSDLYRMLDDEAHKEEEFPTLDWDEIDTENVNEDSNERVDIAEELETLDQQTNGDVTNEIKEVRAELLEAEQNIGGSLAGTDYHRLDKDAEEQFYHNRDRYGVGKRGESATVAEASRRWDAEFGRVEDRVSNRAWTRVSNALKKAQTSGRSIARQATAKELRASPPKVEAKHLAAARQEVADDLRVLANVFVDLRTDEEKSAAALSAELNMQKNEMEIEADLLAEEIFDARNEKEYKERAALGEAGAVQALEIIRKKKLGEYEIKALAARETRAEIDRLLAATSGDAAGIVANVEKIQGNAEKVLDESKIAAAAEKEAVATTPASTTSAVATTETAGLSTHSKFVNSEVAYLEQIGGDVAEVDRFELAMLEQSKKYGLDTDAAIDIYQKVQKDMDTNKALLIYQTEWEARRTAFLALPEAERVAQATAAVNITHPEIQLGEGKIDKELQAHLIERYREAREKHWIPGFMVNPLEEMAPKQLVSEITSRLDRSKISDDKKAQLKFHVGPILRRLQGNLESRAKRYAYKEAFDKSVAAKEPIAITAAMAKQPIAKLAARAKLIDAGIKKQDKATLESRLTDVQKSARVAHEAENARWKSLSEDQKKAEIDAAYKLHQAIRAVPEHQLEATKSNLLDTIVRGKPFAQQLRNGTATEFDENEHLEGLSVGPDQDWWEDVLDLPFDKLSSLQVDEALAARQDQNVAELNVRLVLDREQQTSLGLTPETVAPLSSNDAAAEFKRSYEFRKSADYITYLYATMNNTLTVRDNAGAQNPNQLVLDLETGYWVPAKEAALKLQQQNEKRTLGDLFVWRREFHDMVERDQEKREYNDSDNLLDESASAGDLHSSIHDISLRDIPIAAYAVLDKDPISFVKFLNQHITDIYTGRFFNHRVWVELGDEALSEIAPAEGKALPRKESATDIPISLYTIQAPRTIMAPRDFTSSEMKTFTDIMSTNPEFEEWLEDSTDFDRVQWWEKEICGNDPENEDAESDDAETRPPPLPFIKREIVPKQQHWATLNDTQQELLLDPVTKRPTHIELDGLVMRNFLQEWIFEELEETQNQEDGWDELDAEWFAVNAGEQELERDMLEELVDVDPYFGRIKKRLTEKYMEPEDPEELMPHLADEMVPNPHVKPLELERDEDGHLAYLVNDESELYNPFRTDVRVPFEHRPAGSLSEKHALHHFELRKRPEDEIAHEISEIKVAMQLQTQEAHERPSGKVAKILQEVERWKMRQLEPKEADVEAEAKRLSAQEKLIADSNKVAKENPTLVEASQPVSKPVSAAPVPTTQPSPIPFSPSNPVAVEVEDTASLAGIRPEMQLSVQELSADIAGIAREEQITVEEHPEVLVRENEIDADLLHEIIMDQIEEYELIAFDKYGRMLTTQQIDHTPFHLLQKALARIGYVPNEFHDYQLYQTRHISAGSFDLYNRQLMIDIYMQKHSKAAKLRRIKEIRSRVDMYGRRINRRLSQDDVLFLLEHEMFEEKERELFEVMTEEEIAIWREYNTDEGVVRWIASGGLFKTQAEWAEETRRGSAKKVDMTPISDYPQLQAIGESLETHDEKVLKQESERVLSTIEDLKLLHWQPDLYLHMFRNDMSGEFTDEGRKWIEKSLETMTSPAQRIAFLKQMLEWKQIVGGDRAVNDDFTVKGWFSDHMKAAKAANERRRLEGRFDKDEDDEDDEIADENAAFVRGPDDPILIGADGKPCAPDIFEVQGPDGEMTRVRIDEEGEHIPLSKEEMILTAPPRMTLDQEFAVAQEKAGSGDEDARAKDEDEEGEGEDEEEKATRESDDVEHPLLAQWSKPSTLRHVKELPHMDPARYNEFQTMLNLKQKLYRVMAHHFPTGGITLKLNQPQLYYPERKFREHYAGAEEGLKSATNGQSGLHLFQAVFLMRKYRNASILCEHIAREMGSAKSHSGVLRSVENIVKWMESIPGLDTGLKIKVSGRINGAARTRHYFISSGNIPLQTFHANIDYAQAHAHARIGVFGVKVWLFQRKLDRKEMQSYSLLRKQKSKTKNRLL